MSLQLFPKTDFGVKTTCDNQEKIYIFFHFMKMKNSLKKSYLKKKKKIALSARTQRCSEYLKLHEQITWLMTMDLILCLLANLLLWSKGGNFYPYQEKNYRNFLETYKITEILLESLICQKYLQKSKIPQTFILVILDVSSVFWSSYRFRGI